MSYDLSRLYLHSVGMSLTLTFLNANTGTVLSEHKCYVLWNLLRQTACSVHCHALHWCCDYDSLKEEIEHLKQAFKNNWKNSWVIQQALHTKDKHQTTTKKPAGVAWLPCHHSISN